MTTDTYSQEYRHRCYICWILKQRVELGKKWTDGFFERIAKRHGQEFADKVRKDCNHQWKHGNRGDVSDWN